ncbi:hypothetical protein SD37_31690 [Amycolatopsis orientalis]|uniref:Uncharacterized protein n=1 Tax=Amycolatopsis orientalis TaxID=31958 RepID=A0A193C5K5_AMYOR|nr:hypothetical protein [Amycolatopsis orientalis]ANN19734.1 hypothetical protein SD37_31690 [Amycolatopsis orientalis]
MAYGNSFADMHQDICGHLKVALNGLVTGTWFATGDEHNMSDSAFADLKTRRITATREAEELIAQALKRLDQVNPDHASNGSKG